MANKKIDNLLAQYQDLGFDLDDIEPADVDDALDDPDLREL